MSQSEGILGQLTKLNNFKTMLSLRVKFKMAAKMAAKTIFFCKEHFKEIEYINHLESSGNVTRSHGTRTKSGKIIFLICRNIKCFNFKLNDISLIIIAQYFPHEKSIFLLEIPLFSIDFLNVYWAVSS